MSDPSRDAPTAPEADTRYRPWGLPGRGSACDAVPAQAFAATDGAVLPFGAGRSYGDSCTVRAGTLLDARPGARVDSFDPASGRLTADAGVSLGALQAAIAPTHVLPVTPGTQFATLGGAIANDVHGKNHHRRGSFGAHVTALTLRRSDREGPLHLEPGDPLFAATIGGMGMTGLIEHATLSCLAVPSPMIEQTTVRLQSLADYFARAEEADARHEYAVAWIDSLAAGETLGRGHLITGDHVAADMPAHRAKRRLSVPFTPPVPALNALTLRAFNTLYFKRVPKEGSRRVVAPEPFFYPLDAVRDWNRLYGPRGLHQHQAVLPFANAREAVGEMLRLTQRHRHGSFLTVLKRLGESRSPGLISFARPGVTLTLDFPDRGARTLELLAALDDIALQAGGALNPYKDRRMSAEAFDRSMPRWREVEALRDPQIVSDFWRRTALTLAPTAAGAARLEGAA